MSEDKNEPRYEVSIPSTAVRVEGEERTTIASLKLEYFDLSYVDLVAIENELSKFIQRLVELGITKAESMGQGKKLAALGLKKDC